MHTRQTTTQQYMLQGIDHADNNQNTPILALGTYTTFSEAQEALANVKVSGAAWIAQISHLTN